MEPVKPKQQYMQAVPPKSDALLAISDWLNKAQNFASQPFGYKNPPGEMLINALGVPSIQKTVERAAYGEPMTTGSGMTTQLRPEVLDTLMALLPLSGKKLPVKEIPKEPFTVRLNRDPMIGMGRVEAVDPNGKVIGFLDAELGKKGTPTDPALTHFAQVEPEWQRKGVGSALYNKFDETAGYTMPATLNLSTPAFNLWSKRHPERMEKWMKNEIRNSMPSNFELQDAPVREHYIKMYENNLKNEEMEPHYKKITESVLNNMKDLHNIWLKHEVSLPQIFFGNQ
jgi:GNAT superfamily N-acetyltransferase